MKNINELSRIDKFLYTFNNKPGGDSARKWSAFLSVSLSAFLSLRFTSSENLETVITIWLVFACLCLAIVTAEQVITLKNGASSSPAPEDKPKEPIV